MNFKESYFSESWFLHSWISDNSSTYLVGVVCELTRYVNSELRTESDTYQGLEKWGLLFLLSGWHWGWAWGSRPAMMQCIALILHFPIPSSSISMLLKLWSSFIFWVKVQGTVLPSDKSINFCFWMWNHLVTDIDTIGTQWEEGNESTQCEATVLSRFYIMAPVLEVLVIWEEGKASMYGIIRKQS